MFREATTPSPTISRHYYQAPAFWIDTVGRSDFIEVRVDMGEAGAEPPRFRRSAENEQPPCHIEPDHSERTRRLP